MNYLHSKVDVRKFVAGIKLMRQIFQFPAFDEFDSKEIAPGVEVQSDTELESYVRNNCSTGHHASGTCKMRTDPMAVVDSELRVYGVEGLRVADASIVPTLVGGNTNNVPVMMVGEKAADFIKAAGGISSVN